MANETKRVYGTQFTLSSGSDAQIANAAIGTPAGANNPYSTTQTGDFPHMILTLSSGWGATGTENGVVDVHIVPQNVDGTTDATDISATYRPYWKGAFVRDDLASTQVLVCEVYDVPKDGKIVLYNNGGATLSANYTLKATPFTFGPV